MSSTNDRFFLDTNVLVYSFDVRAPEKKRRSQELMLAALTTQRGLISYQVVQEFMNVATRKFANPFSLHEGVRFLEEVLMPLCRVFPSKELYVKALEISERYRYSWYDSLMIAAALEADCRYLYSEDMQHGQQIESLNVFNPYQ